MSSPLYLKSACHHRLQRKEIAAHKIAFVTHEGHYGYMAMPFGLLKEVCAGAILMIFLSANKLI